MQRWKQTALPGLLIFIFVCAAYLPALHNGFIWDDDKHLTENPCVVGPLGLKEIWTTANARICPLVQTTFWFEYRIWGLRPLPYHLVNILIHAADVVLLWLVLMRLKVPGAWLGAALWGLHPVQVETVAWITELKNTQSTFFYLLTILFFTQSLQAGSNEEDAGSKRATKFYVFSLVAGLLAMASKSSTVILPLVLLLCAWWQEHRWRWVNLVKVSPFFLMSVADSVLSVWTQNLEGANQVPYHRSLGERVVVAGKVAWFYLEKLLWPHPLIFIYPRWQVDAMSASAYVPTAVLLIVMAVLWWKRKSWGRPAFFASVYFLIALLPVLGLVDHFFLRYSFVGDHFQYLASQGALAFAGAALYWLLNRLQLWGKAEGEASCAMLLGLLAMLTWSQCAMYADTETLWRVTVDRNPSAWMAHNNLATLLQRQGRIDEAMEHWLISIQYDPNDYKTLDDVAVYRLHQKRYDEATDYYRRALLISKDGEKAYAYTGLAQICVGRGDYPGAIDNYRKAIAINPDYPPACNELAWLLATSSKAGLRDGTQAVKLAEHVCELTQNRQPIMLITLSEAYAEVGRFPDAIAITERIERMPESAAIPGLLQKNREVLELYRSGRAYHENALPENK